FRRVLFRSRTTNAAPGSHRALGSPHRTQGRGPARQLADTHTAAADPDRAPRGRHPLRPTEHPRVPTGRRRTGGMRHRLPEQPGSCPRGTLRAWCNRLALHPVHHARASPLTARVALVLLRLFAGGGTPFPTCTTGSRTLLLRRGRTVTAGLHAAALGRARERQPLRDLSPELLTLQCDGHGLPRDLRLRRDRTRVPRGRRLGGRPGSPAVTARGGGLRLTGLLRLRSLLGLLLLGLLHLQVEHQADGLLLQRVEHRIEHVEALTLVLHERIALGHRPQPDALLEVIHLVEVLTP